MRALLGLCAVIALGCTVTSVRVGSARLHGAALSPGVLLESVVEQLGVPDRIVTRSDGFDLSYRFTLRDEKRFQVGAYGFKLATDERVEQREGSLELSFDGGGRLVDSRVRERVRRNEE